MPRRIFALVMAAALFIAVPVTAPQAQSTPSVETELLRALDVMFRLETTTDAAARHALQAELGAIFAEIKMKSPTGSCGPAARWITHGSPYLPVSPANWIASASSLIPDITPPAGCGRETEIIDLANLILARRPGLKGFAPTGWHSGNLFITALHRDRRPRSLGSF